MSVKLHEVMSAAHQRAAALAAEVAGYFALGAADQIAGAPRRVGWDDVLLMDDGSVRIGGGTPVDDVEAERALRELLGHMLLEASSVTPSLLRAAHKPHGAGVDALIRELEAALIPVNRAAARRALSRLHRDVGRARDKNMLRPFSPELTHSPPPRAPASPIPAPAERPSTAEFQESVEMPRLLLRAAEPDVDQGVVSDAERSWLTPDTVAVMDVPWPAEPRAMTLVAEAPHAFVEERVADELETVIPVYVVEDDELEVEPELEPEPETEALSVVAAAPELPVPEVPDLEVPPTPDAPIPEPRRTRDEPATVPQPAVVRARTAQTLDQPRTPMMGSQIAVLEPPPWPPMQPSEPVPAVLELGGDDATERTPEVCEDEQDIFDVDADEIDAVEIEQALADVARAFGDSPEANGDDALATWDPPLAAPEPPEHPSPVPEIIATLRSDRAPEVEPTEDTADAAEPTEDTADAAEPELAPEASSGPLPLVALDPEPITDEVLAELPARPGLARYAPPRYAPKKSSLDDLLSGFSVADARSERELCVDLKALAGVEGTAPPPEVSLSETPPPVAVTDETPDAPSGADDREHPSARVAAGAASAALLVLGLGYATLHAEQSGSASSAVAVAAARPSEARVGESRSEPPCAAELTVRDVPVRARTRIRVGPDAELREPSRISAGNAVFEGLQCREPVEVTVELPGHSRWVRIPVSGQALAPSAEQPSFVRFAVATR